MARLDDILNEVETELGLNHFQKTASEEKISGSKVSDLASQLKLASSEVDGMSDLFFKDNGVDEYAVRTLTEKIAHYQCMAETCLNIQLLSQIDQLEKRALAEGVSQEKTAQFIEKFSSKKYRSLGKIAPYLAALSGAGAAGAAGHKSGKSKGKDQGYNQALSDVNQAMKAYNI